MPKRSQRTTDKSRSSSETGRLRVVGGTLRSRVIEFATDPRTRPMKDRTREAVFSLLGGHLDDYLVADLFAGSGILSFEAISRGARFAVAVELLAKAARDIRQNAEKLGVSQQVVTVLADTFHWTETGIKLLHETWLEMNDSSLAWCVFVCPPYQLWKDEGSRLSQLVERWVSAAPAKSLFAVELDLSTPHSSLPTSVGWKIRNYPPATIAIAEKE